MAKKPLSEQVVVVAGGGYGLGRAIARGAGGRGARVVVGSRGEEPLDNAVREIEGVGSEALAVPFDAASEDDCHVLVERAVERFGRIDTFVANQMVTVYSEVEELTAEELRRVFEVNFFGVVWCYQAALPHLKESSGTFLQVNSALAYRGIPLQAAYCASKGALRNFFESARVELQKHGHDVAISLVLPGAINTPQFDRGRQKQGLQPQPVPPIYQPEPFAEAVLHCCEHPIRELPVGWGAQKLLWGQKLAPRIADWQLRRTGWSGQTTGEPKPVGAPDNLFDPLPGDPGAHGRFDGRARDSTLWTTLRLRPGLATLLALLGIGAPAALARVAQANGHGRSRVGKATRIG